MVHVSAACNPHFHTTGSHYLGADTTAFMQLLTSDLFADFPALRLIIPHGGGAVPYHWGRFRGLAQDMGRPPLDELLLGNVFFDTCVYHQAGIDCLLAVIPADNVLFASEMVGAVRGIDPETGHHYDDTRRYIDAADADRRRPHQDLRDQRPPRLPAPGRGRRDDTATSSSATIDRADRATVDALGALGTATVHEAIGRRGFAGPHLRPIQQGVRLAGTAVTVSSHPGDNLMIHAAVEVCQEGDVLVVTNTAPSTHGMFGELLATLADGPRGARRSSSTPACATPPSCGRWASPCGRSTCRARARSRPAPGRSTCRSCSARARGRPRRRGVRRRRRGRGRGP